MNTRMVFSRRQLLTRGAATAAVSLPVVRAMSQVASSPKSPSSSGHQITLLTPSIPGFKELVESLYPGLTKDTRFSHLFPLSALVQAPQELSVRALSLVWTVTSPNGDYSAPVFFTAPPGTQRGPGKSLTVVTAQVDMIPAGGYVLFTPYFSWSPATYTQIASTWPSTIKSKMPADFFATQVGSISSVSVSLDAAIFVDRTVIGPDVNNLLDRIRVKRNAEHDETWILKKMLKAGTSDDIVVAYLTRKATAPRPDGSGTKRWYRLARRQQAQRLLLKKSNLEPETFKKHILRITAMKKTLFRRLPAEA